MNEGQILTGRLTGYYRWWTPVSDIVVGDLVQDEVHGAVYRVTVRTDPGGGVLVFEADVDAALSAPGTEIQDTQLVFRDTTTQFYVLKTEAPAAERVREVPA